ncbi:MAG: FecR domain-containing protein [Verrucomicrobiota bacterium]
MSADKESPSTRTAFDWPLETGATAAVVVEIERLRRVRRTRRRRVAGLAAVSILAVTGAWFGLELGQPKSEPILSALSSRRVLADGSVAELKPDTEIAVVYTNSTRAVSLLRGVAHFKVVKHANRPFVVTVGGIQVRAVGTAFEVDLGQTSIAVQVDEGRVAVEEAGAGEHVVRTYVSAGNRVVVERPHSPATVALATASALPAAGPVAQPGQSIPRLDLAATPLAEVVVIFNRYSGKRLVLADPALGAVQLSGVLRADNLDALLKLLTAHYGITPEIHGNEIVLGRGP